MSPLGPIYVSEKQPDYLSPTLLDRIDDATKEIIHGQMQRACEVITSERDSIGRLVELLLQRDTVEADEIMKCFAFSN